MYEEVIKKLVEETAKECNVDVKIVTNVVNSPFELIHYFLLNAKNTSFRYIIYMKLNFIGKYEFTKSKIKSKPLMRILEKTTVIDHGKIS